MCRFTRSRDEHISSGNETYFLHDEDDEIDKDESTTQHQIPRSTTIDFIQSFRKHGDNDSFITPKRALKILDFCHLLVSHAPIQKEEEDRLVHKWFNINPCD